jgi:hypothetical protein
MRSLILLLLSVVVASAVGPARAQQPNNAPVAPTSPLRPPPSSPAAPRPYQAIAVKLPGGPEDASFETFRQEFAGVVKRRVYAELARLVSGQDFFWDRDYAGGWDRKRPGVDNLAAAVRLEERNGMGWGTLAVFAAEPTASAFTGRPGIICAPGEAYYSNVDFDRLVDITRSTPRDWATPRAELTIVRAAPRNNAAVVETLGLNLVRVFGYIAKDAEPDTLRAAWARVATPAGKIGFVAPGALLALAPERLCYGTDGFGRWRIAGYVGPGE